MKPYFRQITPRPYYPPRPYVTPSYIPVPSQRVAVSDSARGLGANNSRDINVNVRCCNCCTRTGIKTIAIVERENSIVTTEEAPCHGQNQSSLSTISCEAIKVILQTEETCLR